MATARLGSISLDCADPAPMADFWAGLLGGDIAFTSETFVAVKTDRMWPCNGASLSGNHCWVRSSA
jgi:hypothetical protein